MYTDIELFNPSQFEKDLKIKARNELTVFRKALERGHNILKKRFQTHKNATHYVTQRAWLVDQILLYAWKQHATGIDFNTNAFIAVGGYGRGELHPCSDIDLLILLESPPDQTTQACIESLIMFLWDIRLEIGHSVRTLAECEEKAVADITVATNLMETRLLIGAEQLFQTMQTVISSSHVWSNKAFFTAKLEEQIQRYSKYDDTVYNLEPDIKEGPGGLRDIQMIGWVAKRHFGAKTLYDLVQHGFLTEKEYQTLIDGQEFLWEIRCLLHLAAKRHEDRLLFDYQRILATKLSYEDDEAGLGVEKLMKRYYRTVKEISTLNDMLLQLFQEAILYASTHKKVSPLNRRFQVRNDFIEVTHDKVFLRYPWSMLEIFLLMQEHPEIKGIRAATIRLILHYNYLIDDVFRQDLRARSLFVEILKAPQGLTHALRRMNNYGVLAAYIPTFGSIVGQMQYDLFHIYTVDQHTIFVVSNLRCFTLPEFADDFPFCSELMQNIPKQELLYLAGLFHDVAKGRGGDHSKLGEKDAIDFCLTHDLGNNDARFVGWLVRNHLLMSNTAQRQDLSDPEVIKTFALHIEDILHLDCLYLLTVADIRATNPPKWNNWKDTLLKELYHKVRAILHQGDVLDKQFHIFSIRKAARLLLNRPDENERITALWEDFGDEYFLYSSPQNIAYETQVLLNQGISGNPLVLKRDDSKGGTQFIIYAQDRDYLFAEITYFLEQQNLNIVDAYIILYPSSEYTFSSYTVLEDNGQQIEQDERVDDILQGIKQAIISDADSSFCPITRHIPRRVKHFSIPTQVSFTQDPGNNHTIIKVITTDRPGVLSRIAQAFLVCQARVKNAKIITLGSRVEDIFFITDYENHALYSAERLNCLREQLTRLLDEDMSN